MEGRLYIISYLYPYLWFLENIFLHIFGFGKYLLIIHNILLQVSNQNTLAKQKMGQYEFQFQLEIFPCSRKFDIIHSPTLKTSLACFYQNRPRSSAKCFRLKGSSEFTRITDFNSRYGSYLKREKDDMI